MPLGILGSLVVCTILYILFSYVLTGVAPYTDFIKAGKEASVAYAIETYMHGYHWLATLVTIAILAGFSSVILVMLMGQSRVFIQCQQTDCYQKFSQIFIQNSVHRIRATWFYLFCWFVCRFRSGNSGWRSNFYRNPLCFCTCLFGRLDLAQKRSGVTQTFKTPLVPLVPILGMVVCTAMIVSLPNETLISALVWMLIGLMVYFGYSKTTVN